MPQPEFRPASAADLEAFYGHPPPYSMKAWVAVLDDQPIAVAGVAYVRGMPPRMFSDLKPSMRAYRKAIVKGARRMLGAMEGITALTVADPSETGSRRLLERLGFEFVGHGHTGPVYRWRG